MKIKNKSTALKQAIRDGYVTSTDIYIRPWTTIKLSKLLKEAIDSEIDTPHLANEVWEYFPRKGLLRCAPGQYNTDFHHLYK